MRPFSIMPLSRRGLHLLGEVRWLLGYALVVEATFQSLLRAWSEVLEILLFVAITGGFLVATLVLKGFRGLVGMATDTWTQRLAALFLLALALSFLWGDHSTRSVFALLRLPTYLIIIAMVVETLRREERIRSFAWTILGAVCLLYMLTAIEFYFGSDVLGLKCADVPNCVRRYGEDRHWEGFLFVQKSITEFAKDGRVFVQTVIGNAYGLNRLGLFSILAYALGMGILLQSERMRPKLIAAGLVAMVLCGLTLTGSRSGVLAVLIACIVFVVRTALNTRAFHHVKILALTSLAIFALMVSLWQTLPAGVTALDRLVIASGEWDEKVRGPSEEKSNVKHTGRLDIDSWRLKNWKFALDLWFDNPVGGSGFRTFRKEFVQRFSETSALGVHNGYLKVLAEAGLLGALPFLALLAYALAVMWPAPASGLSASATIWKVAFLSAFIAMLIVNLVDVHSQARYFWIALAFAALLETWKREGGVAGVRE